MSEAGSFPGYVSITNAPTTVGTAAVVAKMSWPGGVQPAQDGNVYGNYDGYPAEQQGYPQNMYQQY